MNRQDRDEARRREALRDIERAGEQSEVFATSALRRAARSAADHFAAKDAGNDWAEIWGRRIARALALAVLIALAVHLIGTYILK